MIFPRLVIHIAGETAYDISRNLTINKLITVYYY